MKETVPRFFSDFAKNTSTEATFSWGPMVALPKRKISKAWLRRIPICIDWSNEAIRMEALIDHYQECGSSRHYGAYFMRRGFWLPLERPQGMRR